MSKIKELGTCPDCEKENVEMTSQGICVVCRTRKTNAKSRNKVYIPYKDLSEEEKRKTDYRQKVNRELGIQRKKKTREAALKKESIEELPKLVAPNNENYYQSKAEQKPIEIHPMKVIDDEDKDPLSDQNNFIKILRDCGCEIPEDNLNNVLNVLTATNKLKDILIPITENDNQEAMLNLEQALNAVERKLQHDWEYNGFKEEDDIKFKNFLTWRRTLKGAIFFWKKLYQTNTLLEIQKAWKAYNQDPTDKALLAGDKINSELKRFQITTESISTIFNTKKPFTRVFYATSKETAYEMFLKWMSDRQFHENKSKTTITELKSEGEKVKDE